MCDTVRLLEGAAPQRYVVTGVMEKQLKVDNLQLIVKFSYQPYSSYQSISIHQVKYIFIYISLYKFTYSCGER